jgi:hypothetical protein
VAVAGWIWAIFGALGLAVFLLGLLGLAETDWTLGLRERLLLGGTSSGMLLLGTALVRGRAWALPVTAGLAASLALFFAIWTPYALVSRPESHDALFGIVAGTLLCLLPLVLLLLPSSRAWFRETKRAPAAS